MDVSEALVDRSSSVSSTRTRKVPWVLRASSQLNMAVRAPPTCSEPVGEGAKRTRVGWSKVTVLLMWWRGLRWLLCVLSCVLCEEKKDDRGRRREEEGEERSAKDPLMMRLTL